MSRRGEVERSLTEIPRAEHSMAVFCRKLCRTMADEVDDERALTMFVRNELAEANGIIAKLRAEADPDSLTICYMQGRGAGDAEARERDRIITEVLALLEPGEKPACNSPHDDCQCVTWDKKQRLHARACEIAGRTE